jgi:lipid II:glycine glycyltransferase (peptidoglycan interpeptide bridge formation enzyme)
VFLAHWKGKSVSGVFVVIDGKTVYALGAGSFATGWEARPNDLLHWKVMEWACENGYLKYNMGGVDEPPPTEGSSKWGIWRWKREWKGNLERIETFDKIILPQYKPMLQARNLVYRGIRRLK